MDDRTRRIWEDVLARERNLLERDARLPKRVNWKAISNRPLYYVDPERAMRLAAETHNLVEQRKRLNTSSLEAICEANRADRWRKVLERKVRQVFKKVPSGGLQVRVMFGEPLRIGVMEHLSWIHHRRFPSKKRILEVSGDPRVVTVSEGWVTDGAYRFKQVSGNGHGVIREPVERSCSPA